MPSRWDVPAVQWRSGLWDQEDVSEQSRTLAGGEQLHLHEALGLHILTAGSVLLETRGETACSNHRVTIEGLEVGLRDRPVCVRPWVQCGAPQRSELAVAMELLSECQ